eukprot:453460-Prymnesium_polylepis.2
MSYLRRVGGRAASNHAAVWLPHTEATNGALCSRTASSRAAGDKLHHVHHVEVEFVTGCCGFWVRDCGRSYLGRELGTGTRAAQAGWAAGTTALWVCGMFCDVYGETASS